MIGMYIRQGWRHWRTARLSIASSHQAVCRGIRLCWLARSHSPLQPRRLDQPLYSARYEALRLPVGRRLWPGRVKKQSLLLGRW